MAAHMATFERGLLSVVIPHWNGLPHLPVCMAALRAQTYPHVEILVADNASTDGSQSWLREHYPEAAIIQLDKNYGFTGACNAGFRVAKGEFIALLNNDTEVDAGWATAIIRAFGRHPEAGFLASKMMLFDRRNYLHNAGDFYGVDGWPGNTGAWQLDAPEYNAEKYVFSACAGASVYRRGMLDEIGLLDESFFFSMEDMDLAWRAQAAGYRCVYVPEAVVYHKVSASGGGVTSSFYDGRNAFYLLVKHYPTPLLRKYWRRILGKYAQVAGEALRAWRGAAARARLRGMVMGLLRIPWLLTKRGAIQRSRKVSVEYIESMLKQ